MWRKIFLVGKLSIRRKLLSLTGSFVKSALIILALMIFAACLPASGAEEEVLMIDDLLLGDDFGPLARAEITVDIEKNGNIVQIPQLVWDEGSRKNGLDLNKKILNFIGDYEAHLALAPGSCEIRSYHYVMGPSYINIIIIKDMQPQDGNIGEIKTYVYDYRFDEICEQSKTLEEYEVDVGAVNAWMTEGGYLPEGEKVRAAELSGAVLGFRELDLLYTVSVSTSDETEERRLYVFRWRDGSFEDEEYEGELWPRVMGAEQYLTYWLPMKQR